MAQMVWMVPYSKCYMCPDNNGIFYSDIAGQLVEDNIRPPLRILRRDQRSHGNTACPGGKIMEFSEYILVDKKPAVTHDIRKWGEFMKSKDRIVAQDHVGHYLVSTVFLGINHSFGRGEPLLFETMVFDENTRHKRYGNIPREYMDNYQERYHTWEEAEIGHKRIVDMVEMGGTK